MFVSSVERKRKSRMKKAGALRDAGETHESLVSVTVPASVTDCKTEFIKVEEQEPFRRRKLVN